jgi:hypothetical protein
MQSLMNPPQLSPPKTQPGPLFVTALAAVALINPLAVHLFMPVIPAIKAAFGVSATTQFEKVPLNNANPQFTKL